VGVCASRINLPAQNTLLTILNALPLAYAESNVGSTQAGFILALVKELLDDAEYWRRTRVPWLINGLQSVKKQNRASTTTVVQVLFRWDVFEVDPPNHISNSPEGEGLDDYDLIFALVIII
jgi:hypothetical protein